MCETPSPFAAANLYLFFSSTFSLPFFYFVFTFYFYLYFYLLSLYYFLFFSVIVLPAKTVPGSAAAA